MVEPARKSTRTMLRKVKRSCQGKLHSKQGNLIGVLNSIIWGWADYHRHQVAKRTFQLVDHWIWWKLGRWTKRRHPKKRGWWVKDRCFHCIDLRNWKFTCATDHILAKMERKRMTLVEVRNTPIAGHVEVRALSNPYDPSWLPYLEGRKLLAMRNSLARHQNAFRLWEQQRGRCPHCA